MGRYLLRDKGFSLLELSIAMGVIAILTSAMIPMAVRSVEIKAAEKTIAEVGLIQEAAKKFYVDNKTWPASVVVLQAGGYLSPLWSLNNPWNDPYLISSTAKTLSITTHAPDNLVAMLAFRLPQSSINATAVTSTINLAGSEGGVAAGVIVAWSGTIAQIPQGWVLCDGDNGTPDLRDKFIIGARQDVGGMAKTYVTDSYTKTGGSIAHNHRGETGSHVLTIAQIPSHQHASWGEAFPELAPWGVAPDGRGFLGDGNSDRDNYFYMTSPVGGGQGHVHSISSDTHIPPYYALAFIMKL